MHRLQLVADTHTHTIASGHAYSTITENMNAAAKIGLRFLASTDHTGIMSPVSHQYYFENQKVLPDELSGVYLLRGCEANVMDETGALDIPEREIAKLEWVIASMHTPVFAPRDSEAHTAAWLAVAKNPHIDVIGHCGDERYRFNYAPVIRAFAEAGKIVEINANSFRVRPGSGRNCREIALLCKEYGARIVVNSDAHFWAGIGDFGCALQMLEEIGFPEELIVNADFDRFAVAAAEKSGRTFLKERIS